MGLLLPLPLPPICLGFFNSTEVVYVFIQWLYLKLLNFSFMSSSALL